jgi:hypothetical protein
MSTPCISGATSGTGSLDRGSANRINPTTNAAAIRPGGAACVGNSDRRHAKQLYSKELLQCGPARATAWQLRS